MTKSEKTETSHLAHLHAVLVFLLEAHSSMTSTVPVLGLASAVGTAGTAVE